MYGFRGTCSTRMYMILQVCQALRRRLNMRRSPPEKGFKCGVEDGGNLEHTSRDQPMNIIISRPQQAEPSPKQWNRSSNSGKYAKPFETSGAPTGIFRRRYSNTPQNPSQVFETGLAFWSNLETPTSGNMSDPHPKHNRKVGLNVLVLY